MYYKSIESLVESFLDSTDSKKKDDVTKFLIRQIDRMPDYLFLMGKFNETWSEVIKLFDKNIFTNNNEFVFDLVWENNSSKLFSIKYRN